MQNFTVGLLIWEKWRKYENKYISIMYSPRRGIRWRDGRMGPFLPTLINFDLHAILRIISRGVSGIATDSPCGVLGRGWTICLLHDSPLFGSHFIMRVGMKVWSDISYISYHFLPRFTVSCMKLVGFLLYNNIFIYQTLCTLIHRRHSLYSFLINSRMVE